MVDLHVVPGDFPREPSPGFVSGAQAKLLVRERGGRYYSGLTGEELWTRYMASEDLARQLATYTSQKMLRSGWSLDDTLEKVEKSVNGKVGAGEWDLSQAEIIWIMARTRELLRGTSDSSATGDGHETG